MKTDTWKQKILFKAFLLTILLFISWKLWESFDLSIEQLRGYLSQFPFVVSGSIFVFLYVITTTFVWIGPKDLFRLSGAILFGAYVSTIFITLSELLNAFIMFSLSRNMGREYVIRNFPVTSEQLERTKNRERFYAVFALKINLLFPLRFLDLGYGLSKISLGKYLIISLFALPVRIFFQQYMVAIVGESIVTDTSSAIITLSQNPYIVKWSIFYTVTVLVPTFIVIVLKLFRKNLTKG